MNSSYESQKWLIFHEQEFGCFQKMSLVDTAHLVSETRALQSRSKWGIWPPKELMCCVASQIFLNLYALTIFFMQVKYSHRGNCYTLLIYAWKKKVRVFLLKLCCFTEELYRTCFANLNKYLIRIDCTLFKQR